MDTVQDVVQPTPPEILSLAAHASPLRVPLAGFVGYAIPLIYGTLTGFLRVPAG
jgi:hypothetical protein